MKHLQLIQQKQILSQYQQTALSVLESSNSELVQLLKSIEAKNPILRTNWRNSCCDTTHDLSQYVSAENNYLDELTILFRCSTKDSELHRIGEIIIALLDNKGFLNYSENELCEILNTSSAQITKTLNILNNIGPFGTGSRNLQEYLCLQLSDMVYDTTIEKQIIRDHIELFAKKDFHKLARLLNTSFERILDAADQIQSLQPYPFIGKNVGSSAYISPDLIVTLNDGELSVSLANTLPSLTIDSFYEENTSQPEIHVWGKSLANDARDIISAVAQRQQTLLLIGQYILDVQRTFFTHHIAPGSLTQADIALALNLSTSTVSRALANKYLLFQNKLIPLKNFLSSKTASGHSKEQIKSIISSIIDTESPSSPISDADIARQLEKRGFSVSRRTITKYRQALGIPSFECRRVAL